MRQASVPVRAGVLSPAPTVHLCLRRGAGWGEHSTNIMRGGQGDANSPMDKAACPLESSQQLHSSICHLDTDGYRRGSTCRELPMQEASYCSTCCSPQGRQVPLQGPLLGELWAVLSWCSLDISEQPLSGDFQLFLPAIWILGAQKEPRTPKRASMLSQETQSRATCGVVSRIRVAGGQRPYSPEGTEVKYDCQFLMIL